MATPELASTPVPVHVQALPPRHYSTAQLVLDPAAVPRSNRNLAFAAFLEREYGFSLKAPPPICKDYEQGHCPRGSECPDRHPPRSNSNSLICKHYLRGLCKKGEHCEYLHEYNLRAMPECDKFNRHGACTNGADCLYLHVDEMHRRAPCKWYERGFCPLGPHCDSRHVKRARFCPNYMAGFCPDGRTCGRGAHPTWRDDADMARPKPRVVLTKAEKDEQQRALMDKLDEERREEDKARGFAPAFDGGRDGGRDGRSYGQPRQFRDGGGGGRDGRDNRDRDGGRGYHRGGFGGERRGRDGPRY